MGSENTNNTNMPPAGAMDNRLSGRILGAFGSINRSITGMFNNRASTKASNGSVSGSESELSSEDESDEQSDPEPEPGLDTENESLPTDSENEEMSNSEETEVEDVPPLTPKKEIDQQEIDRLLKRMPSTKLSAVSTLFGSHAKWRRSLTGRWKRMSIPRKSRQSNVVTEQKQPSTEIVASNPLFVSSEPPSAPRSPTHSQDSSMMEVDISNESSSEDEVHTPDTIKEENSTKTANEPKKEEQRPPSPTKRRMIFSFRKSKQNSSFYEKAGNDPGKYYYGGSIFTGGSFAAPVKPRVRVASILMDKLPKRNVVNEQDASSKPKWKLVGGRWVKVMRRLSQRLSGTFSRKSSSGSDEVIQE